MRRDFAQAGALLKPAQTITVLSHIRPDGDAVGSLLALARILERMDKRAVPVLPDGMPGRFRFLPGAERVQSSLPGEADLVVAVDCSDLARLGLLAEPLGGRVDLNIDHHATNTRFGRLNLVDDRAAATAEMLYDLAIDQGWPLDSEAATNLLLGLVTDTIGFRTANVTPKVLRQAASLVELGAPLAEVYDRGLNRRSLAAARYWGSGLRSLESEGPLVWAVLKAEDRRASGYAGHDDADLINLLSALDGAEAAIVFVEQPAGEVKVSWRARSGLDVAKLAQAFGGGGHEPAAGAMIKGDLREVVERVLAATRAALHPPGEGRT